MVDGADAPRDHDPHRGDSTVLVVTRELAAVAGVRAHLRGVAAEWGLDDLPTMEIVVAELVTNAIVHGRGEPIVRMVNLGSAQVRIEVGDAAPGRPRRVEPYDGHTRGLGLHIVDAVSDEWGVTPPGPGSKVVWADLQLDPVGSPRPG